MSLHLYILYLFSLDRRIRCRPLGSSLDSLDSWWWCNLQGTGVAMASFFPVAVELNAYEDEGDDEERTMEYHVSTCYFQVV